MKNTIGRIERERPTKCGTTLPELAGITFAFFFLIALPMIDLGSLVYRVSLVFGAVRDASAQAATSLTYMNPIAESAGPTGNNRPAVSTATHAVQNYITPFGGVRANSVRIGIIVVDNKTGVKSGPFYQPLSFVDDTANTYYIDVSCSAQTEPLAKYLSPIVGPVPGVATPLTFEPHSQRRFENPRGLTM